MWNKIRENFEIIVSLVLLALLFTCIDPLKSLMPSEWEKTLILALIAIYGLYAAVIFREKTRDERERHHLALAERAGFLVGAGLLVLFIILNLLGKTVEKQLVFVLAGMVLAKMIVLTIVKNRY